HRNYPSAPAAGRHAELLLSRRGMMETEDAMCESSFWILRDRGGVIRPDVGAPDRRWIPGRDAAGPVPPVSARPRKERTLCSEWRVPERRGDLPDDRSTTSRESVEPRPCRNGGLGGVDRRRVPTWVRGP